MSTEAEYLSGGLIHEGGEVVGAWLLDRHGLQVSPQHAGRLGHVIAAGRLVTGHGHGRPVAHNAVARKGPQNPPTGVAEIVARVRADEEVGRRPARTFVNFLSVVRSRRSLAEGTGPLPRAVRERHLEVLGHEPDADESARVREEARLSAEAVAPFLARLDPFAVEAAFLDARCRLDDDAYAALDPWFDPEAPLAAIMRVVPGLPHVAHEVWRFDRPNGPVDAARVRSVLPRYLSAHKGLADQARVDSVLALGARFAGMPMEDRRRAFRNSAHSDPAHGLHDVVTALPPSWRPRDGDGWVGLLRCEHVVRHAMHSTRGPEELARFVGGGGRWIALGERLSRVDPQRAGDRQLDVTPVTDMGAAFANQVLRPACPGLIRRHATIASHSVLFGGRGMLRMMEMARDWHARQGAILAPLPTLQGDAWGKGLPDWERDGVRIVVVDTARGLSAEGASGTDGNGVAGLSHCVGGYAPKCRRGTARIIGVRQVTDGREVRLSTAEFDVASGPALALRQHRGARNAAPPEAAERAVAAYLAALTDGRLTVDWSVLRPTERADGVAEDAGYDVTVPGAVEAAWAGWETLLPRALRRGGLDGLRDAVAALDAGESRWWSRPPRVPVVGSEG